MNKQITKIRKCKKKVVVYFNKDKMDLSFDTFSNFYFYVGKELTNKELKEIKEYDKATSLSKYAYGLINKSRYSEYAIREKLYLKGANKKEVDLVIAKLKKAGLIDDKAYAKDLIDYLSSKNYGKNKIIKMLSDKGVFINDNITMDFPFNQEINKARTILPSLEKRYAKYNYQQQKAHIYNALIAKGFEPEVINTLLSNLNKIDVNAEQTKLKKDYQIAKEKLSRKYKGKQLHDKIISSLLIKGYRYQDIIKMR